MRVRPLPVDGLAEPVAVGVGGGGEEAVGPGGGHGSGAAAEVGAAVGLGGCQRRILKPSCSKWWSFDRTSVMPRLRQATIDDASVRL